MTATDTFALLSRLMVASGLVRSIGIMPISLVTAVSMLEVLHVIRGKPPSTGMVPLGRL